MRLRVTWMGEALRGGLVNELMDEVGHADTVLLSR